MRGRVAFFPADRRRRFLATIKFLRRCGLEKSGGGWLCSSRGLLTCPKNGTGGHSITPADLEANEKAENPPQANLGVKKGIQATTYGYADFP
jgi:hypothetical protein